MSDELIIKKEWLLRLKEKQLKTEAQYFAISLAVAEAEEEIKKLEKYPNSFISEQEQMTN